MRLFQRKRANPWDQDDPLDLGAWVALPPASPYAIMGALFSVMRAQWMVAEDQLRLWRFQKWLSWFWFLLSLLNIFWVCQARGWL